MILNYCSLVKRGEKKRGSVVGVRLLGVQERRGMWQGDGVSSTCAFVVLVEHVVVGLREYICTIKNNLS